jgi:hypothetical protein
MSNKLFKSLHPDNSHFETSATAGMQEAEHRWPLFKAVPPVKPQASPSLTDEDRQHWLSSTPAGAEQSKPALTMPGLSDKLAQGLNKMAGSKPTTRRTTAKTAKPEKVTPAAPVKKVAIKPTEPVFEAPVALEMPAPVAPKVLEKSVPVAKKLGEMLHSTPPAMQQEPAETAVPVVRMPAAAPTPVRQPAAVTAIEPPAQAPVRMRAPVAPPAVLPAAVAKPLPAAPRLQPSAPIAQPVSKPEPKPAIQLKPVKSARSNESLKSLFSRLETPEPPVEIKPAVKKSSFLGRLGRR